MDHRPAVRLLLVALLPGTLLPSSAPAQARLALPGLLRRAGPTPPAAPSLRTGGPLPGGAIRDTQALRPARTPPRGIVDAEARRQGPLPSSNLPIEQVPPAAGQALSRADVTEPFGEEMRPSPSARECRIQGSLESGPPPRFPALPAIEREALQGLSSLERALPGPERGAAGDAPAALHEFYSGGAPRVSGVESGAVNAAPRRPLENGREAADPKKFALRAQRLFHPGLAPGRTAAVLAGPQGPLPEGAPPSEEEMRRRAAISPLTNPERERAVIELLQAAGAAYHPDRAAVARPDFTRDGEIQVQEAGQKGKHNIFVVKQGRTDRVVVIGAHHDKVARGAGTIDNWSGASEGINLYQAWRDRDTEATYVFVLFAREEEGLIGSKLWLDSLSEAQKRKIDSMVNLDTLAVDGTYSWKNNSTKSLLKLIRDVAARTRLALTEATLWGGDSDSSPFRWAGIAAMTIFGASQDIIFDIIHSEKDTIAYFNLDHYVNTYKLILELLLALDAQPTPRPA